MVRYHWHVEGGHSSFTPPGGVSFDKETNLITVQCDMELSGQNETCPALFTLSAASYGETDALKPVGIVLGHGANAEEWKGPFLTALAEHFAKQGYLVMRYYCKKKEARRQRIYEKALDTAATSPYARNVKSWVLVGHENGARIAASTGSRCRRPRAGFILLSYPLLEPSPPPSKTKIGAPPPQDSTGPLMRLSEYSPAPTLFICGEMDYNCPGAELKKVADKLTNMDTRAVILQDLDSKFNTGGASHPTPEAMNQIFNAMDTFLSAIQSGSLLSSCDLPRLVDIVPSTRVPPRPAHLNEQPGYEDEGGDDDEEDEEERSQEGEQGKQKHQGGANAGNGDVPASWQQQLQQVLSANPQLQAQAQSQLQMTILQQQMAMAAAAVGNRQPQVHITLAEGPQIVTRKPNDGQKKP